MFDSFNTFISELMGPFGLMFVLGAIGLVLVLATVVMMVNQPKDPLDKLKRDQSARRADQGEVTTLRQKEGNAQLQKFAKFLEPEDEGELSQKQLELR
jgi:tight adherence protein C